MEDLARLVAESLARNGYDAPVDHRRLQWSRWLLCESSLSFLWVPCVPGIYALGEDLASSSSASAPRTLAVFRIADTEDLSASLAHLFAPGHPLRDRLSSGRCYARYARVADPDQRQAACAALRHWLTAAPELPSGLPVHAVSPSELVPPAPPAPAAPRRSPPPSLPTGV